MLGFNQPVLKQGFDPQIKQKILLALKQQNHIDIINMLRKDAERLWHHAPNMMFELYYMIVDFAVIHKEALLLKNIAPYFVGKIYAFPTQSINTILKNEDIGMLFSLLQSGLVDVNFPLNGQGSIPFPVNIEAKPAMLLDMVNRRSKNNLSNLLSMNYGAITYADHVNFSLAYQGNWPAIIDNINNGYGNPYAREPYVSNMTYGWTLSQHAFHQGFVDICNWLESLPDQGLLVRPTVESEVGNNDTSPEKSEESEFPLDLSNPFQLVKPAKSFTPSYEALEEQPLGISYLKDSTDTFVKPAEKNKAAKEGLGAIGQGRPKAKL